MDRDGAPLDLDPGGHLCWLPDIKTMMNMPKKEQQKYLWKILWLMYKNPPSMVGCCGCCEGKSLLLFPAPTNCHKIVESGVEQDGENIISSISHSVDWNLGKKKFEYFRNIFTSLASSVSLAPSFTAAVSEKQASSSTRFNQSALYVETGRSSVSFDSGIILKSSGGLVLTVNITAGEPATNLKLFLKIMISQRPSSVSQSYQRRCIEVRTSRNSSPTFRISDMVLATKLSVELRSDQDHKMLMSWVLSQICIFMSSISNWALCSYCLKNLETRPPLLIVSMNGVSITSLSSTSSSSSSSLSKSSHASSISFWALLKSP